MHLNHVVQALIFAFSGVVTASSFEKRYEDMKVKHEWFQVPTGWHDKGPANPNEFLNLRIALKQDGFAELVDHLHAVSDPSHSRYGAHLSKDEVDALIAPHSESVSLVDDWLVYHDIDLSSVSRSDAGDWISLTVPVSLAEQMLGASYRTFYNPDSETTVTRTLQYKLPAVLHDHIDVVTPTTYINGMRAMKGTISKADSTDTISSEVAAAQLQSLQAGVIIPQSCYNTTTPACLKLFYKINYFPESPMSKLGITGYLETYASYGDLNHFYAEFVPQAVGFNFTTVLINGGLNNQSDPGAEANLDTQYGGALSFPIPNTFFSTGGLPPFIPDYITLTDTNEPYYNFLQYILAQENPPSVITTSYGDSEQSVPYDYATTVCNMFAQLGARGVSVLFSSGDGGVGGGACTSNDGKNTTTFIRAFPATCPYVTAVGGTYLNELGLEEGVYFSGGGFSDYFPRPEYQTAAVEEYLLYLGNNYEGLYNASGRAFPDVSALSTNFQIVVGGVTESVYGTSCSTPTFSAIVSLLNDIRFMSGKSALGFLNPLLYSKGYLGLNDILTGSNPGCGTNGFNATIGWDPVTGMGTPNFAKFREVIEVEL